MYLEVEISAMKKNKLRVSVPEVIKGERDGFIQE